MSAPSLYIVPTPIGNLADITLRALEVLKSVDLILAEDTRTSGFLLKHYAIARPLQSFHNFNEHKILTSLIQRLEKGEVMALVSDAGTPGISDPGFLIIRAALQAGLKVECLPGPTAFVPALVKSGLPSDRFVFEGFLPQKKGRQTLLKKLAEEERTMIFYESPYRLVKTLEHFKEYFGAERKASVSRELTKMFEETVNGTIEEILTHFQAKEVKGEIVMVVSGKDD
ncbi:16S rRNA (cytidine(1402)-2'-O)-methyltransferase [Ohtaekwangia koreensis]|jgi:16S rRNA (cytidine1402-2'-O)-methyltransferase|uniref:Ribosomal RNA small subunit methyltransferase I n=1 Tax=Ohtaekwangia koreensis TaxID=688867 RepID=A0A1T5IHK2_9BACT|nr:16S rRNA (cytidine(1402)-2'-O)-methyltransferase [Ohtaekwangia koreensis]SKC38681.1 16S rRNA (cytidine1402-2'-O)-methyltransferase [Ohtaekwangia koreensis]